MSDAQQAVEEFSETASRLYHEGDFEGALSAARSALALAQEQCGADRDLIATCLTNLGTLLHAAMDCAGARPCFEQALEIHRSILGNDHPDTAASLARLGDLLQTAGDLTGARALLEEAVQINRRALGNDHPHTAASLNNLGGLLLELGDYSAARPPLEEGLSLTRHMVGEDHPETATCLHNLGCLLQTMNELGGARTYHEQALAVRRRALGDDHPDTARSLTSLGDTLRAMGDYTGARGCLEQSLEVRRRVLGAEHPSVAHTLYNLGLLLKAEGAYASALKHLECALETCKRVRGEDHPHTLAILDQLGSLLTVMADYAHALPYLEQALETRRRTLGDDHDATVTSLSNLGRLLQTVGDYREAQRCFEQALETRRRTLGDDHLDTARSLHELGSLLAATGDSGGARTALSRSLETHRRVLGNEHPETASSLTSLGTVLYEAGDYAGARRHLEEAVRIARLALGADNPRTALFLRNLGASLKQMGDYRGARKHLEEALDLNRKSFGNDHPETATSLSWLGSLLLVTGDFTGARAHLEEALEIRRRSLGMAHPHTALSLLDLGTCLRARGEHAAAHRCDEEAWNIQRRAFGETHPQTVASLNNLGLSLSGCGDQTGAQASLERALEVSRQGYGEHHPNTTTARYNLCFQYVGTGRVDDGRLLMQTASADDDRMIGELLSVGSERQRTAFLKSLRGRLDSSLSLTLRYFQQSLSAVQSASDFVLRRKALGAEFLVIQQDAAIGARHPQLEPVLRELSAIRVQLVRHSLAGSIGSERHERTFVELAERRDQLEADLARQIPEMNLEQRLRAADRRAVALALDASVALVEFVRFDEYDFHAVPARGESRWKPARYLAFVLLAGQPDAVRMIDLGEADPIDRMIASFRASIASPPDDPDRADTRDMVRRGDRRTPAATGAELRAVVFDPLVPALDGRTRLILSPDGELSRLPFAALPTDDGRVLGDTYRMSYVGTGRDVLRFGAVLTTRAEEPLVVCDPDFDLGAGTGTVENRPEVSVGRASRDMHAGVSGVRRLPGTLAEGRAVGDLLGVAPWHGDRAAKKPFLGACRSPRVLHLATHGFFLEDQDTNLDRELWGRLLDAGGQLRADVGENPLLRSGLVLAGANTFLRGDVTPEDVDNGLLTALDVTGMDLLGTELVVLSACRTAEGDVHVGEGVIGLQRAFTIAGARTLVMSLWSVDDEATRALMVGFYRRLLAGEGKAEALRHAQEELRARPEFADPYYWGAFICQGDPGPLRESPTGS